MRDHTARTTENQYAGRVLNTVCRTCETGWSALRSRGGDQFRMSTSNVCVENERLDGLLRTFRGSGQLDAF